MGQTRSQISLFDWLRGRGDEAPRGVLEVSALPKDADSDLASVLHGLLETHLGTVDLIVTDNRRRMVSVRRRGRRYEFRIHHMFLGCDERVVEALIGLSKSNPEARETIRAHVAANRRQIRQKSSKLAIRTKGECHDLEELLASAATLVAPLEFPDVVITWGKQGTGTRTIRFGSFDFERRLIRIHPALDQAWVPRYFVEFVVFHELLHAVYPPECKKGRRVIHSPEFREREKTFPSYAQAMKWEHENLERILRRR